MDGKKYDLLILGASGYTGQFVVEEVGRVSQKNPLTYAIAGRNENKLKVVLEDAALHTKLDFKGVDIIIADVNDYDSLLSMAKQATLVINCVGPYRFYGETVVKACIEEGAHHIDISGEPQYLEQVQLNFDEFAQKKGLYIVGSCGFDSIPADLGTIFLQENFGGDVNNVEMIVGLDDSSVGSAPGNATTLECAVHGYSQRDELRSIRKKLHTERPPKSNYKPQSRGNLWWNEESRRWCIPNIASDRSVVMRTQNLNYKLQEKRPIQFTAYFGMQSWWSGVKAVLFGLIFVFMTSFSWTKKLLLKYPSFFTFGGFAWGGAKRDDLEKIRFCVTLIGKGWNSYITSADEQHPNPPDVIKVAKVLGPDPGYATTAILSVQSALVVLEEKDKLPSSGGVFTPGSAFLNTSLIRRLQENGIKFEMVKE